MTTATVIPCEICRRDVTVTDWAARDVRCAECTGGILGALGWDGGADGALALTRILVGGLALGLLERARLRVEAWVQR